MGKWRVLCLFLVAACAACIGKDVQKGIEKGLKEKGSIPYQEVGISDDELSQKYYYQQLEDGEITSMFRLWKPFPRRL